MITFIFAIKNPFFKSIQQFKNIRSWHGATPFKNKYWEVEVTRAGYLVELDLTATVRTDHAGVILAIGLFNYSITLSIYDNRHWDYDTNHWVIHTKEEKNK